MSSTGLSKEQRKAMLDEETGDGTGEIEITDPPTPTPPVAEPPPPPPAPPSDVNALISALVTGITQANAGTAEAIRDALGNAAAMARDPIPENKIDPGHSVYSHPDGDQKTPRTALRCKMYLGIYDEFGVSKPAFEIYEDTSTEVERLELNKLVAGAYPGITRNDGVSAMCRVVQSTDDNGAPTRVVIAVPQMWLSQEQFQQMPGLLNLLRQLNAAAAAKAAA